jgi:hypothetical protein
MASPKKIDSVSMILEIESFAVRGRLVTIDKRNHQQTILELGIDIPFHESDDSSKLADKTIVAIKAIVEGVVKNFILRRDSKEDPQIPKRLSYVHCILSSPWIISQAQVVSRSFNKPAKISERLVNKLISHKDAKPNLHITRREHESGNLVIIEKKVLSVSLNGYQTDSWQDKSAKTVDVSFIVSSAGTRFISAIEEICKGVTGVDRIDFHSSLMLHYAYSVRLVPDASSHVCVHIHNELTDIISINKTGGIFFASYPIGLRTIIRRIALAMGVSNHTAESMLALYSDLHLDQAHNRKSGILIERILHSWKNDFHSFLKLSGVTMHSSSHMFVYAKKHEKLFTRLMRVPNSYSNIEPLTDDIYSKAIHSLA